MKLNWKTANDQINRSFIFLKKKNFYHRGFSAQPRGSIHVYDHYLQTNFLETLGQSRPNFIWSPLEKRECKFCENGLTHMNKMAAMPIYGKIFCRIQSPVFLKQVSKFDLDLFTSKVRFGCLYIRMGKLLIHINKSFNRSTLQQRKRYLK